MDMLKHLNDAVQAIEENLCEEDPSDRAAAIACTSPDGFCRIFSYLTGVSVAEYIRRRRLTKAAYELQNGGARILELAVKYGYESADSFSRAFYKQHGIAPSQARKPGVALTVYPPISFHIRLKGRSKMTCRIEEKESFPVFGISRRFTGDAADRWEQEHELWSCDGEREAVSDRIPGVWYGIWNGGEYRIARDAETDHKSNLSAFTIPKGKYAVFETGFGGFAGSVLPELRKKIFEEWLPDSGYATAGDVEIEVYRLFKKEEKQKRHYEIWIPIK